MKWQRPRAGQATRDAGPQIVADDGRPLDAYTSGPSDAAPVLSPRRRRATTARVIAMLAATVAFVGFLAGGRLTGELSPPPSMPPIEAQAVQVQPGAPSLAPIPSYPTFDALLADDQPTPRPWTRAPGATTPPPP